MSHSWQNWADSSTTPLESLVRKLDRYSDYSTGVTGEKIGQILLQLLILRRLLILRLHHWSYSWINWSDSSTAAVGLTKCKLDVREAHSGGVEVPEVQSEAHL